VVLNVAIVPLREPDAVELRARLRPGVTPADVQALLDERVQTPVREAPRIILEELDDEEVVVRIQATPASEADGPHLATEVLEAVARETRRSEDDVRRGNGGTARSKDGDGAAQSDEDAAKSGAGDQDATHGDDAARVGAAEAVGSDGTRGGA
jgi:hypothetical protein